MRCEKRKEMKKEDEEKRRKKKRPTERNTDQVGLRVHELSPFFSSEGWGGGLLAWNFLGNFRSVRSG